MYCEDGQTNKNVTPEALEETAHSIELDMKEKILLRVRLGPFS
jgi:hypothetical protein